MIFKIIICEDEPLFLEGLKSQIGNCFIKRNMQCEFLCCNSGTSFETIIQKMNPNLIFMDIGLGDADGMKLIEDYRKNHLGKAPVIFVSSMEDRVLEGYEVNALSFLYKRNYQDKLERTLERFFKEYADQAKLTIKGNGNITLIGIHDIYYIESDGRKSIVHSESLSVVDDRTITAFMEELPSNLFFEVYKAIYVNLEHIIRIDETKVILDNQEQVIISRRKRKPVMEALMRYMEDSK